MCLFKPLGPVHQAPTNDDAGLIASHLCRSSPAYIHQKLRVMVFLHEKSPNILPIKLLSPSSWNVSSCRQLMPHPHPLFDPPKTHFSFFLKWKYWHNSPMPRVVAKEHAKRVFKSPKCAAWSLRSDRFCYIARIESNSKDGRRALWSGVAQVQN
jgi:hypothetical protein